MPKRLIGGLLLLALAAAGAAAYRSDRLLFDSPANATLRRARKIGHALARRHDLAFLMTFDESTPVEWIARGPVRFPGTELVPGRIGRARRFDGNAHTHLSTSATWPELGPTYTLSLWARLEPTGADQDIWSTAFQDQLAGFRLADGHLTFHVPGGSAPQAARYPFAAWNRLVHLAAVVDGPGGQARLYEDGVLKDTIPVEAVAHPRHNIEFGKTRWYAASAPLRGSLEEAAAWKRALSPAEIRSLSRARHSLPLRLEPLACLRWRLARSIQETLPLVLRLLDRFNPLFHEGRANAAHLPEIHLQLSSADTRHFFREHDRSLASGRRTARGANPRRILARCGGHALDAQLWLDGSDTRYPFSRRPAYILEIPPDAPPGASRSLRLTPPESDSSAPSATSPSPGDWCRLVINGHFKGIYARRSFDHRGLAPGQLATAAAGPKNPNDWRALFRDPFPPPPSIWRAQDRDLLVNDLFHPWSAREWAWRIRTSSPEAPTPPPTAFSVLGSNPSPHFIVGDLDLPPGFTWKSSRPDLIDAAGHVTRPPDDQPVHVELAPLPLAHDRPPPAPFHFRVMPLHRKLPALFLHVDEPLSGIRRVDFDALFLPPQDDAPPLRLRGGQATRGGIQHRGNSSFWTGRKKPLSLRFDAPHHLLGPTDARHLYLRNGCIDLTKMRDKLVFDLFRSFASPSRPRFAPQIDWTEVFVNGAFAGIYECCSRVDGFLLGFPSPPSPDTAAALYAISAPTSFFADASPHMCVRVHPRSDVDRPLAPLQDFLDFTSQASPDAFARDIARRLDLDNAIDFFLLLNFSGNLDGRTTNFFLAQNPSPGAPFFFVPWDYDNTFFAYPTPELSNPLFDRLRRDCPGFEDRLRLRWNELRQGPLSDSSLDARIDAMASRLSGQMEDEYLLLGLPPSPSFPDHVDALRRAAHDNLRTLDLRFPAF